MLRTLSLIAFVIVLLVACRQEEMVMSHTTARPNAPQKQDAAGHDSHAFTNALIDETSPYLLLHAHNPVDWYPWGEEALAKAKAEGKMIFLSIGYSSCYWCHVMERESFVDEEIAQLLNKHFISIKVDREERPDIDAIYMTALQIYLQAVGSPQGGGWPMSMFLTPDGEPIMGGTYYPPRDRGGHVGFLTLTKRLSEAWRETPDPMQQTAEQLSAMVRAQLQSRPVEVQELTSQPLDNGLSALERQYDPQYGGFGYSVMNPRIPKFPVASNLRFLLDRVERLPESDEAHRRAKTMLIRTLEKMAAGAIRDHLGGGFHRYSTDRFWRIPHFEKMLYDNGQLASVYSEAYRLTGRDDFRYVVEEMLDFVRREMTSPEGGFYSALDAETDAEEGRYYVWLHDELTGTLSEDELTLFADVYGIGDEPNFEGTYYAIELSGPLVSLAKTRGQSEKELRGELDGIRKKLMAVRDGRQRPLTDTKVLCAWNGLMIGGFADAARCLDRPDYLEPAQRSARFVLDKLRTPDGRLLRTYGQGKAKLNAYLDDYAFLVDGLIGLHRASGNSEWLDEAERLTQKQIELFWDDERGGFFFTSDDHESLLARSKDPADSAIPSGNSVSVGNLVYLAQALGKDEYRDRAQKTLEAFGTLLEQSPGSAARMAVSLAAWLESQP